MQMPAIGIDMRGAPMRRLHNGNSVPEITGIMPALIIGRFAVGGYMKVEPIVAAYRAEVVLEIAAPVKAGMIGSLTVGRDMMPSVITDDSCQMLVKAEAAMEPTRIGGAAIGKDMPGVITALNGGQTWCMEFQHLIKPGFIGRFAVMEVMCAAGGDPCFCPTGGPLNDLLHVPDSSGLRMLQLRHSG